MERINGGPRRPLLFIATRLLASLLAFSLVGCSSHKDLPLFSASGYIADQGINRLWREDDDKHNPQTLINIYSPYYGKDTVITRYEYLDGQLHLIKESHAASKNLGIILRFDQEGNVSFMQRQLSEGKEKLSADDIERYKYQAEKVLSLSETLRAGNVRLVQGRWRQGVITTCAAEPVTLSLNIRSQVWLAKRAAKANDKLGLAWLTAPEGNELLLVANEDFCIWEPKAGQLN
ncbi:MAG: DUF1481 domain-containing protein [Rouxiella aceris]|uniref:DUF1481 domain-containing protein n=1 Tax=Rouxiella aceris TaxID=2703884 RepID=UPI00285057D6|nr:DUF1481 domain-containing protein [Rouxiella aceris]MDR3430378.1 DUF1481 domain-containing protein [Rouxiella aceris]